MGTGGIYEIVNTVNGKRYIGQAVNFAKRFTRHRYELERGEHHSSHLQRAWNKHGADPFRFEIIMLCIDGAARNEWEQKYIDAFKPEYNIALNVVSPMLGRKTSDETKAKQAKVKIGKVASDETRAKIGETSRNRSPESNLKISIAATGRVVSAETGAKISRALKGKKRSPEFCARISKAQEGNTNALGFKHPPDFGERISGSKKGKKRKPFSPEWRANLSAAGFRHGVNARVAKAYERLMQFAWAGA